MSIDVHKNPHHKLRNTYIIALALIAVLLISSQVMIRYSLSRQSYDASVINISGRQRMLSQRLTKITLMLNLGDLKKTEELKKALQLWTKSHYALIKGDKELNTDGKNSDVVKAMFKDIEPYFQKMKNAIEHILASPQDKKILQKYTQIILENEGKFLERMNKITFQYDAEATARVEHLKTTELILLILALMTLLLEAFLIFRPAHKALSTYIVEVKSKHQDLRRAYSEIQTSEEELEQSMEELMTTQEALEKNQKILKSQNAQIGHSIKSALTIQKAILPRPDKMNEFLGEHFVIYKPKDVVSGDFYWIGKENQASILAVADCTGHGVPGAFMSLIGVSLLNKLVHEWGLTNPAMILHFLHQEVKSILKQEKMYNNYGMDLGIMAIYDTEHRQRKIVYAGAKRSLYYAKAQSSQLETLVGTRKSIGGIQIEERRFTNHTITVNRGGMIYLGTDGFEDQNNEKRRKFGTNRLTTLFQQICNAPIEQQKTILEVQLAKHMEHTEQRDDILMLGVRL
jgi:phosphoserine phosphatase RsbU/P